MVKRLPRARVWQRKVRSPQVPGVSVRGPARLTHQVCAAVRTGPVSRGRQRAGDPAWTAGDPQKTGFPNRGGSAGPAASGCSQVNRAPRGSGDFESLSVTSHPSTPQECQPPALKTHTHTPLVMRSPQMEGDGRSAQDQGRGQGRALAPPLQRKQAG